VATELHEQRLDMVVHHLVSSGATRVLDLGCASGELLQRLAWQPQFTRIVGIDIDQRALGEARDVLGLSPTGCSARIQVRYGSFEDVDRGLTGFDAAALVEVIEHIDPRRLHRVEEAVFGGMCPGMVLVTTPNQEYNRLHGLAPTERRHPGHRFEWSRKKFRQWARGVAARRGYRAEFFDVGPPHPVYGSSTQMARFVRGRG
jgi:small RNA 2'-O-methyltransferase